MGKILETLIYRDGGGNRRLRDYAKVTLGILVLIVAVIAVAVHNRSQMISVVMATPRPLDTSSIPAPSEQILAPTVQAEECPRDPAAWVLTDSVMAGSNLKGLAPQCVYDSLERTVAWLYSTYVLGQSHIHAADLLGFSDIPIIYAEQLTVLTDFKDEPQKANLRFPSDNNNLAEWRVDSIGNPAVEFSFSGCFRTAKMVGGDVKPYGDAYPVICQYSGDFHYEYYVGDVNGKAVTARNDKNIRRSMWFGYTSDGGWVFLGFAKDWDVELSENLDYLASTIDPTTMSEKYGISLSPLPENWIVFTGQEYSDAFLKELGGAK
ncbi:MAG TPA: hypothetical protein VHP14_23975 [Anaerolineales bacterium]|nr:hypothetical protein [Anaerolineales bacterium]